MKAKTIIVFIGLKILECSLIAAPYLGYICFKTFLKFISPSPSSFSFPDFWSFTGIMMGMAGMLAILFIGLLVFIFWKIIPMWIQTNIKWAKKITKEKL